MTKPLTIKTSVTFREAEPIEKPILIWLRSLRGQTPWTHLVKAAAANRSWNLPADIMATDIGGERELRVQLAFSAEDGQTFTELLGLTPDPGLRPTLLKLRMFRPEIAVPTIDVLVALAAKNWRLPLKRRLLWRGIGLSATGIAQLSTVGEIAEHLIALADQERGDHDTPSAPRSPV